MQLRAMTLVFFTFAERSMIPSKYLRSQSGILLKWNTWLNPKPVFESTEVRPYKKKFYMHTAHSVYFFSQNYLLQGFDQIKAGRTQRQDGYGCSSSHVNYVLESEIVYSF